MQELYVEVSITETVLLSVSPLFTIREVKEKIETMCSINRNEQILYYNNNNMLQDGETIMSYGITDGAHIRLVRKQQNQFYKLQIFVKTIEGKNNPFEVDSTTTIHELKLKIQDKFGPNPNDQTLISEGRKLEDKNGDQTLTIGDYGIQNGATIYLTISTSNVKEQLFIKIFDGRIITINISLDETVDKLYELVKQKVNFPPGYDHKLISGGKCLTSGKTLRESNVQNNATIQLIIQLRGGK